MSAYAEALLSEPTDKAPTVDPSVPRASVPHLDQSGPFRIRNPNFERQYSHTYAQRLHAMRERCKRAAVAAWPQVPFVSRTIDLKTSQDSVFVGTLFKEMKLKPCVLEQFQESSIMAGPKPQLSSYISDTDHLIVEDPTGRVVIEIGDTSKIDLSKLVSGIVVGIRGAVQETGTFRATDICFCEPARAGPTAAATAPSSSSASNGARKGSVLFVSGIEVGTNESMLPLQLLVDYVAGHCGSPEEQSSSVASICRVVVAGNTIDMEPNLVAAENSRLKAELEASSSSKGPKAKSSSSSKGSRNDESDEHAVQPLRNADYLMAQLARAVFVDVMPGSRDPANVVLPQQSMHHCLFPRSSGFRDTFSLVTNPYKCVFGDKKDTSSVCILGHSGQPVEDIARFSSLCDPLDALESTVVWQHLAPTAPDTLACFPFKNNDPFVIQGRCPDVLFTGNAEAFGTRNVTLSNGHQVTLIAVPRFSTTGTVAILDLETKEVRSLSIGIDSSLTGAQEDVGEPMDVDSSEAP